MKALTLISKEAKKMFRIHRNDPMTNKLSNRLYICEPNMISLGIDKNFRVNETETQVEIFASKAYVLLYKETLTSLTAIYT